MQLKFRRILHLVLAAQALPLLCGLFIVMALQGVILCTEHSTKTEEKARLALKSCSSVHKRLMRACFSLAMYQTTGLKSDLTEYENSRPELRRIVTQLKELNAAYPKERLVISELVTIAEGFQVAGDQLVVLHQLGYYFGNTREDELYQESAYDVERWGQLNRLLNQGITAELAYSPVSSQSYLTTLCRILIGGLIAEFIACIITAKLLTGYIDRRLSVVKSNSDKLASRLPLLPELGGKDEIATLDKEFHSMAAAIAEATRRETEILENANDIILTVDQSLFIQSANQASVRLYGREKDAAGSSLLDVAAPEDFARLKTFFADCRSSEQAANIELSLRTHNRQVIYSSLAAQWSAENQLFSCVIHDITQRKAAEDAVRAAEQRLRSMLERMPAGMVLVDKSGTIITGNQTATRLLAQSERPLDGIRLSNLLPVPSETSDWLRNAHGSKQVLSPCLPEAGDTQLEVTIDELNVGTGDASIAPTAADQIYLLVMMDITASQKLDLLRHRLIDGISDTIIKPLSSVSDVLQKLDQQAKQEQNERGLKYLSAALGESSRVLSLFSDLLEVESSNVRQLSVEPKDVTVERLFERSLEAVRVTAEKKGITLSAKSIDATLFVDPDRVVQVLVNLIFNALKFTPSGGAVQLESEKLPDGSIELRVADTGCGIPAGMEAQIFEPFKQTKASDSMAKGGSGLGLFICKSLVEKHGGTISAHNRTGSGAVFVINLPQVRTIQISERVGARLASPEPT